MSTLSIPNIFVNYTPADADKLNENFDVVQTVLNGGLTDDNMTSITESSILFGDSGHTHTGGSDGSLIDVSNIDGVITYSRAVMNGAKGSLLYESGSATIAGYGNATVTFDNITNIVTTPLVQVLSATTGYADLIYVLAEIEDDTFKIFNMTADEIIVYYYAIGI